MRHPAQAFNALLRGCFMSSRPVVRLVRETGHRIVGFSGGASGTEIDGVDEHGHPATVVLAYDVLQRISLALTTQADALGLTGHRPVPSG